MKTFNWEYNAIADAHELYINNKITDFIRINRSGKEIYYFRGGRLWSSLEDAKIFMEEHYK